MKTFYRKVEKNNNKLLINNGYSTQPTYAPYQGFSIINIGMGAAVKVELYWYQLESIEGLNDLNKIVDKEIENFYDKIKYSKFHYEEKEVLKNEDWLISPEVDLGVAEETNKFNILLSYEVNVDPLHSIVEIRYEDLMQQKYKKLLYVGYINSVPIMMPISKEYKIE